MPRPVDAGSRYLPGLDGVRALAVALVVGYHLGVPHLDGGLLGVGVFFTLSGYLITHLLLSSYESHGSLRLGRFWLRRARRLLPAVVVLLVAVLGAAAILTPDKLHARAREALAALFYVANWATILSGQSYFSRFADPGPLDHLWSLAIEEQFYLAWPLLVWAMIRVFRGRRGPMAVATLVMAAASGLLMAMVFVPGLDNTRAYEGTDTRAAGLLIGAAAAMLWPIPGQRKAGERPRHAPWWVDVLGGLGLAGIIAQAMLTSEYSPGIYRGGLLLLSVSTVCLVVAAVQRGSWMERVLGVAPLRWLGERSYGIYLWHMPVVVFLGRDFLAGHPVLRGVVLGAVVVALASLSWAIFEDPIRAQGFKHALGRTRLFPGFSPVLAGTIAFTLLFISAMTLTHRYGIDHSRQLVDPGNAVDPPKEAAPAAVSAPQAPPSRSSAPVPSRTSCTTLMHVGDSTSVGLVDERYQPVEQYRIPARYAAVGVTTFRPEISGARSTLETVDGIANAQDVVRTAAEQGFSGCYVFALGTNDTANVGVGSPVSMRARIDSMMKLAGGQPVLWATVKTLKTSGPYADESMRRWNAELQEACTRYPSMRVYDWRAELEDGWFIADQIHFSAQGYVERSARFAKAVAAAFPASGPRAPGCLVRSA